MTLETLAVGRDHRVHLSGVIPPDLAHSDAEPEVAAHVEEIERLVDVLQELGLARVRTRPDVIAVRQRVDGRVNVDLGARVVVDLPDAARPLLGLEHDEVVEPGLLQLDRHRHSTEPSADDDDPWPSQRHLANHDNSLSFVESARETVHLGRH